ncbi:hypothetical protein BGZ65_003182, partial [Modicella reniformis]
WVCIDHYRENYQAKAAQAFRDTVKALGGSFDENVGRVEMTLRSTLQAEQFYMALEKARSVYELMIWLTWKETTYNDFRQLRDTLLKTNVGVLELRCNIERSTTIDILNRSKRYDPIIDIIGHPSIQSFVFTSAPFAFFKRSNLLSRNNNFSHLRYLEIDLVALDAVGPNLKCLVANASQLTSMTLFIYWEMLTRVYNAIAEHQTCPVTFKHHKEVAMRILPPTEESRQSKVALQDLAHLFRVYGQHIEAINLTWRAFDDYALEALAEAAQSGSGLREFLMEDVYRRLGDECIKNIVSIIARSEVRDLFIDLKDEEERVVILESIPWKHIRKLKVRLERENQVIRVMKALVDSMEKVSERVQLEEFAIVCASTSDSMSVAEEELLRTFVSSASLKHLTLNISMALEQMLSVTKSIDVMRLQHFTLRTQDIASTDVQSILDSLPHATNLETIHLLNASITEEQVEQMKTKEISLLPHD